MERKLKVTGDGSHTIYVPELNEHYHSVQGAVAESEHIYISSGFAYSDRNPVKVLEFGMGTGLNVLLTAQQAAATGRMVYYHAIEKYPLSDKELDQLNFSALEPAVFKQIHEAEWGSLVQITETFFLFKEQADFRKSKPVGPFDVIFLDAFGPEVQPALWSYEMFKRAFELAAPGAVLTTYSSKGQVRRNMREAGFRVEKLPGPKGKREIVRATRPFTQNLNSGPN